MVWTRAIARGPSCLRPIETAAAAQYTRFSRLKQRDGLVDAPAGRGRGLSPPMVGQAYRMRKALVARSPLSYYRGRRKQLSEGRTTAVTSTLCSQCDQTESKCHCEKYCCFC